MAEEPPTSNLHILMFPWIAEGHLTPFLHLSNELAARGHRITFVLPQKALNRLQHLNLYPDLISFSILTVPQVDGLPPATETASDIRLSLTHLLMVAFDRTRSQATEILQRQRPDFVFYDFAYWIPEIAAPMGIRSVSYIVVSASSIAIAVVSGETASSGDALPPEYPSTTVVLSSDEMKSLDFLSMPFGEGTTFRQRMIEVLKKSDAIAMRTCKEIEGEFCRYLARKFEKKVLLTGPVLPAPEKTAELDGKWERWLEKFDPETVIFCALGSQLVLEKDQFQELLLGIEQTGLPFLAALRAPMGSRTVEEALPEGFRERIGERGVVHGDWLQQPLILNHRSVGCFVSHCGFGSMWEALMSECRIVLIPHLGDQILNAKLLAEEMKVAAMVGREKDGGFKRERVREAIDAVMKGGEVAERVKKNHAEWKKKLTEPGFMKSYVDKFVEDLQQWRE